MAVHLQHGDLLLLIDVQADLVMGAVAVPDARAAIPPMNRCIREFERRGLPVIATRDWHPLGHVSFRGHGGQWPPHCVQGLPGAEFAPGLALGPEVPVVSKASRTDLDPCSAFDHTQLAMLLRRHKAARLFVCGLAAGDCVRDTVVDALRLGYAVFLLADALRTRDVEPHDGFEAMRAAGAVAIAMRDIDLEAEVDARA